MASNKEDDLSPEKVDVLHDTYYTASDPGSFSSASNLFKSAKKKLPSLKLRDVVEWLSGQHSYTRHKAPKSNFLRRKMAVVGFIFM